MTYFTQSYCNRVSCNVGQNSTINKERTKMSTSIILSTSRTYRTDTVDGSTRKRIYNRVEKT